jgi:hypothetical protein
MDDPSIALVITKRAISTDDDGQHAIVKAYLRSAKKACTYKILKSYVSYICLFHKQFSVL